MKDLRLGEELIGQFRHPRPSAAGWLPAGVWRLRRAFPSSLAISPIPTGAKGEKRPGVWQRAEVGLQHWLDQPEPYGEDEEGPNLAFEFPDVRGQSSVSRDPAIRHELGCGLL